jgi:hypothetical protein
MMCAHHFCITKFYAVPSCLRKTTTAKAARDSCSSSPRVSTDIPALTGFWRNGSWLNLVETFLSKMAGTKLRGIRVKTKAELIGRIEQYLAELNESPVIFR